MVGCTIGGFALIDVSDQSIDSNLPVGQVEWRLSLPTAEAKTPNYSGKNETHFHKNTTDQLVPNTPNRQSQVSLSWESSTSEE